MICSRVVMPELIFPIEDLVHSLSSIYIRSNLSKYPVVVDTPYSGLDVTAWGSRRVRVNIENCPLLSLSVKNAPPNF